MTSIVAAVLAIVYRYVCVWENKRRDKLGNEAFDHAYEDDLTDMKVRMNRFRRKRPLLTSLAEPTVQISAVIYLQQVDYGSARGIV